MEAEALQRLNTTYPLFLLPCHLKWAPLVRVPPCSSPCGLPCTEPYEVTLKSRSDQAFPLEAIWVQGHGVEGATETPQSNDPFMRFLELGPEQTLSALARILGVSHQAIGQVATRFNWKSEPRPTTAAKARRASRNATHRLIRNRRCLRSRPWPHSHPHR